MNTVEENKAMLKTIMKGYDAKAASLEEYLRARGYTVGEHAKRFQELLCSIDICESQGCCNSAAANAMRSKAFEQIAVVLKLS